MKTQTVEKRGKSVDEAIKAALDDLGCEIEDVEVEILEEPTRGILGFIGNKPALVRVTMREKPEEEAREVVENLLQRMKIDYRIQELVWDDGVVKINVTGNDMGLLIGRKGETLNAVQYIAGLIINRHREKEDRIRLVVDVEDYRKKKEESLESLALRLSDKVKRTKKNVVMRPMNSQERRIVHTVLQEDPQVVTYSMGNEPNRKVVISLKK
ncbi:MAG TPA: protein jag [Syntrophomonadaceae bacterium]|nr:protein jag [Syntrophomonadaceae bacterium]